MTFSKSQKYEDNEKIGDWLGLNGAKSAECGNSRVANDAMTHLSHIFRRDPTKVKPRAIKDFWVVMMLMCCVLPSGQGFGR